MINYIKRNKLYFAIVMVFLMGSVPSAHYIEYQLEDINGTFLTIDPSITSSKVKGKTIFHYSATFYFNEYGQKKLSVTKETYEKALQGQMYRFERKDVHSTYLSDLFLILSLLCLAGLISTPIALLLTAWMIKDMKKYRDFK